MKLLTVTVILLVRCVAIYADSELIAAHVVFRHGARAPIDEFSSEESRAHFYRGLGQLTDQGLQQAEVVGKILRDRYVNTSFLDKRMLPNQVSFRSSGSERCLMTMERAAEIMFPNANPPIQTVPRNDDYLLVPKFGCPKVMKELKAEFNLTQVSSSWKGIWEISDLALRRAARNTTHLTEDKPLSLVPSFILEKDVGLAVPAWFNDEAYEEAEYLFYSAIAVMAGAHPYHRPSWIRPKSGYLLSTIFDDLNKKIKCLKTKGCESQRKFFAYSTHDILVLAMLESLGIREAALGINKSPQFCATIIFELWLIDGEPKIKLLFRKKPDETTLINLTNNVRNCQNQIVTEFCEPEAFTKCCNEYLNPDPQTECWGKPDKLKIDFLSWILIGFSVLLLIIVSLLSLRLILYKRIDKMNLKH